MVPHTINFMTGENEDLHEDHPEFQNNQSIGGGQKRRVHALFLLICVIIGLWIVKEYKQNRSVETVRAGVTLEPKKPKNILNKISYIAFNRTDTVGSDLAGSKNDRINVLLLGMGGAGHDGPYLTDTIMIASIKPSTKQVALISIPRDLGINIPGYGYQKINHANAYGELKKPNWGAAYATELIAKTVNLDIPYYIRLDFKAFQEIIDELGGVRVTVDTGFTDPMFPAPKDEFQTISFAAGEQMMDGETALMFARSRHGNNGEGSDFARARRQQKILTALKDQLTDIGVYANPLRVNAIINTLESHVTTNMEFNELVSLAKLGRTLNTDAIISFVPDSSPGGFLENIVTAAGAYMLFPKNGNFTAMNNAIESIFTGAIKNQAPSISPTMETQIKPGKKDSKPSIEIQNGTWNAGLAARVRRRLEFQNIEVAAVNNAPEKPISESGIYIINKKTDSAAIKALIDELRIPHSEKIPIGISPATSTDILIILGDDFID